MRAQDGSPGRKPGERCPIHLPKPAKRAKERRANSVLHSSQRTPGMWHYLLGRRINSPPNNEMRRRKWLKPSPACGSRIICCASSRYWQCVAPCSQPVSQPFTDVISAPATTVKSGPIVRLDITIHNNSSRLLFLVDNRLAPADAGISIWNSSGGQLSPRDQFKPGTPTFGSHFGMYIEPGKSITESVNLNRWFDLTKPGQNIVQASKKIPGSQSVVESNKLTITVVP